MRSEVEKAIKCLHNVNHMDNFHWTYTIMGRIIKEGEISIEYNNLNNSPSTARMHILLCHVLFNIFIELITKDICPMHGIN